MKTGYKLFFIISVIILLSISGCKVFKKEKNYNVLLITIDTLRADRVSVYSKEHVKTPEIDVLAKEGIVFLRAFSEVPLTLPSHTTILTGLTPIGHGVHDNMGFRVDEKIETLAEILKSHGYLTGAVVSAFPLDKRFGLAQGFDYYDDNYGERNENEIFFPERRAEKSVKLAIEWIAKKNKKKFFLWLHLFDPHQPYDPPEPFKTKYKDDPYSGEVAYVDSQLGKLFSFLKKNGIYDKTIIVLTSDHGEALGEHGERTHGYFAYNSTLWVPLIIKIPGENHRIIKDYVSLSDVFPTILDALSIGEKGDIQGESLIKLLQGNPYGKDYIYFESLAPNLNRGWAPLKGVIDVKMKLKFIDLPLKEVYDLRNDFWEKKNLWSSDYKKYRKILNIVEKQLKKEYGSKRKGVSREELKKFESLGYVGGSSSGKRVFTQKDDLKTLLPLQNKMLDALSLYYLGEYKKALGILSEIVKERKDFIAAWNRIITIFKETGYIEAAISTAKKALEYNPDSYSLLLSYGTLLALYGDKFEAINSLKKAEKIMDYDPELWNAEGVCYWKLGEIRKAEEAFKKALSIDENFALVYANMGLMYIDLRFYDKAEKYLKKALSIEPELAIAINGMGALEKKKGNKEKAVFYWEKLIKVSPHSYNGYYNLISTLIELGRYKEALKWYNKALKELNLVKEPGNPNLVELEKLKEEAENYLKE